MLLMEEKSIVHPFGFSCSTIDEKVDAVAADLLEECWFFDNLLDRRKSMSRCYSDLSCSDGISKEQEFDMKTSKLMVEKSQCNLHRTPSLPTNYGREEVVKEKRRVSKTTRKVSSPNFIEIMTKSCSIPRYQPHKSSDSETRKSLSDLESEEIQGFKDLGFRFEKEDLSPSVVRILPGLQDKKSQEDLNQEKVKRPYLSEAWMAQSCTPPFPNWAAKKSSEDMKTDIKCWARAVASNMR